MPEQANNSLTIIAPPECHREQVEISSDVLARRDVLLERARQCSVVTTKEQYETAATVKRDIASALNILEQIRLAAQKPYQSVIDMIRNRTRDLIAVPLTNARDTLQDNLDRWAVAERSRIEKERERLQAEATQRAIAENKRREHERQAEIARQKALADAEADMFGVPVEVQPVAPVVPVAVTYMEPPKPKFEAVKIVELLEFLVVEESLVPRRFLIPEAGLIRKDMHRQGDELRKAIRQSGDEKKGIIIDGIRYFITIASRSK